MRRLLIPLAAGLACVPISAASPHADGARYVRAAIPAIEAYRADHGTYAGVTVAKLRAYDRSVRYVSVRRATRRSYCIQSTLKGPVYHFDGPRGPLRTRACGQRGTPVPPPSPPPPPPGPAGDEGIAKQNVRAAIPAIEAYRADHGTYVGMTLEKLQAYDAAVRNISIARTAKDSYCIQSSVGAATYHVNGPAEGPTPGPCT